MQKALKISVVLLILGIAMVFISSILQGITWGNGFNGTALAQALNNIGYLAAILSGVVLTGLTVTNALNSDNNNKK